MRKVVSENRLAMRLPVACLVALSCSGSLGCGERNKFSAETDDEYTEPFNNVVIGTRSGVITILPTGVSQVAEGAEVKAPVLIGADASNRAGAAPESAATSAAAEGGFGLWHFDDCSPSSQILLDSSGLGANVEHALNADCTEGAKGTGVNFRSTGDVMQVPEEPQFSVGQHLGVAAWVNPKTVEGDQPIVIKRLNNETAFSLGVHKGNIEMSVVLSTGKTVISRAPISADRWTHVAGMFDGTFVFLFIDGKQFGQVYGAGTVRDVSAPIRIGATTQSQYFNGAIDEVFITTQNVGSDALTSLSCITRPSTTTITPQTSGPVPPDTPVHYDVSFKNNDFGACEPKYYLFDISQTQQGISTSQTSDVQLVQPGEAAKFGVSVIGTQEADPGLHIVPFSASASGDGFESLDGQLNYELSDPPGCFVRVRRELMITDLSVVDDPIRTAGAFDPGFPQSNPDGTAAGVWSFGHLMRELAPSPAEAPAMTLDLLQHWLSYQTVNGFSVWPRPAMQSQVIDVWPRTSNGELDLDRSPLTLQAIVNRIDLRNLAEGSAGEGRLIFGVNGPRNFRNFTVSFNYNLVAHSQADVNNWANRWHALGAVPFPSEEYNAALEAITRSFTDRGASPGSPNSSGLSELRTNEAAFSLLWELRSFALSPTTGFLDEVPVKETPELGFNSTSTFTDFVNQNAAAIIAEIPGAYSGVVPALFEGKPFLAGSALNNSIIVWNGPGLTNSEARYHASINTCNGCHGRETNTRSMMVRPRESGQEAELSPFLTGTTAIDNFTCESRTLNDLARREADLSALVCEPTPPARDANQQ
jgi:hypothetical protein